MPVTTAFYLNPPDGALVLCVDEEAQIQALDRTQSVLSLRPSPAERKTRSFATLTEKQIRRGVHRSTGELQTGLEHSIRPSASIPSRVTQRNYFALPNVTRAPQEP